jgi:site-specific DNA-methyltransferase (adenine-specific)
MSIANLPAWWPSKKPWIIGDCLDGMRKLPEESVDFIITDPPYKTEFIPLYGEMAREAERILKPGSLLICLSGHFALDRIIPAMCEHLTWYWIGGMPNSTGSVARNFSRQIMCSWKPSLWFSKGKVKDHAFVFDLFKTKRIERTHHKWEQPVGWFEYYIEKLTAKDSVILDPFLGSGTVLLACRRTGRLGLGFEKDVKYDKTIEERSLANIEVITESNTMR